MTAATLTPAAAPGLIETERPPMTRLVRVELRKMVDTRAGKWLMGVMLLLYVAIDVISLVVQDSPELHDVKGILQFQILPAALLLPVLGVLLVTSEWSQRTALSTFTLVPPRLRTVAAKLAAGAAFALLAVVFSVAFSYLGAGIGAAFRGWSPDWSIPFSLLAGTVVYQVLNVFMGIAFGMVLLSSPLAIVLLFVLPTVFSVLTAMIPKASDVLIWFDANSSLSKLGEDPGPHGEIWGHIVVGALVWIALPLVAGAVRLVRSELK